MLPSSAGDPFAYFDWDVSYITASPLGVPRKVIAISKQFPGPIMNVTTNWNVVVNVLNSLDEPVLLTWDGIQHRKNCWQDGVMGTNCPIPPGWNWTRSAASSTSPPSASSELLVAMVGSLSTTVKSSPCHLGSQMGTSPSLSGIGTSRTTRT
uniref:Plastocyanin-like domain-containing protein n=1 Tax=Musa acuminata subsp. malaccensis TaxID=214687 RepID=A0A804HTP3_MUSAM